MTADQITDLKQFFTVALDAAFTERLAPINIRLDNLEQGLTDLRQEMHQEISNLRQEMNDGFAAVGEAIDYIHVQSDKRDVLIVQLSQKWLNS